MVAVLLVYYWIHKPITPVFGRAIGGASLDILSAVIMALAGAGLGRTILPRIYPKWATALSSGERLSGEVLFGLGILSVLILLVGLVYLHAISIGLLLLVIIVGSYRVIWEWLLEFKAFILRVFSVKRWDRVLLGFIVINLGMALVMALAPPSKFDALVYHLVGPKHWVNEGRFVKLSGSHFFGFLQFIHTLYAGQMALLFGRLTGAAALHWLIGFASLMAVGSYGSRRFSRHVGILAVVVMLTATSIFLEFGWPYVDLPPIGFGMLAYIGLEQWRFAQEEDQQDKLRWLVLASTFVGFTMSVKYPLIGVGVAAGVYVLVYSQRSQIIRNGLILVGVATIVIAPWLIRTWVFYDNPVYPYGPVTGEWDALSNEWYSSPSDSMLNQIAWLWASLPLSSTFLGIEGVSGFDATIGPLFVLLIPMLLITWSALESEKRQFLKSLMVFGGTIGIVWLVLAAITQFGAQTRLWYAMFPIFALLAAMGLDSLKLLPKKPLDFRFVLSAIVGLVLVFTLVDHVRGVRSDNNYLEGTTRTSHFLEKGALQYLLGVIDEDRYLEDALGWYIVAMRETNKLPDDSQILFLWETRSLYCDEPRITCLEDTIILRWWHDRRAIGDGSAADILDDWKDQGATHILIYEDGREFEFDGQERFTDADKEEIEALRMLLEVVWEGEDIYTLYKIPE
jgi:hypothetical protein